MLQVAAGRADEATHEGNQSGIAARVARDELRCEAGAFRKAANGDAFRRLARRGAFLNQLLDKLNR